MEPGAVIAILTGTVLFNNIALTHLMGIHPLMEGSRGIRASLVLGAAVTAVLTLSSVIAVPLYALVLVPHDLTIFAAPVLAVIMALLVSLARLALGAAAPLRGRELDRFLSLVTVNSLVLGAGLLALAAPANAGIPAAALRGFGYGTGFALVLLIMAGIRERLETAELPRHLRGLPIALIAAGILALAFKGLAGIQ